MIGYLALIIFLAFVGFEILHYYERKELLNRIMAKDYEQYKYYDKRFDKDVEEVEKLRGEARKERVFGDEMATDITEESETGVDLRQFEEDWGREEVDITKLKERLRKEDK